MKTSLALLSLILAASATAQVEKKKPVPPAQVVEEAKALQITEPWSSITQSLNPRSLGPVNMGGRITDIAVFEKDPRIFYVASASGGLFKTENKGTTFKPVFEKETSVSLGAVAVAPSNPDVVWVGTGEATSRNSVAWGDGVYKSTDGGKTWKNMGLPETRHIGKIVIDPNNPDIVYVAALGRLWGSNPERGVYKTTNGGATWTQVLKVDDNTGAIELKMDPKNPRNLLCGMWQRLRKPYDFISGGPGGGLYRSTDSGKNWHKVTKGIPTSPLGRIGISYFQKDPKIVVATIEYKPEGKKPEAGATAREGGGTFKSTDGGESWTKINPLNPRPFYFSLPVIDPNDSNRIYVCGDSLNVSKDGGKTFTGTFGSLHPDIHAFWIDPNNSNEILVGCDGGVSFSHDKAVTWDHLNGMPIAQFYAVAVDMRKPYWIYGGLQDNQSWGIPTQTTHGGISFFDSLALPGGDGFHCQVDPNDWTTVYSESQGGSMTRADIRTGATRYIQPRSTGLKLRFNWSTPFKLSPHNSRTIYAGANYLMKSIDRGDTWKAISPDLTTNDSTKLQPGKLSVTPENTGAEMHCTIITLGESPLKQGLLWVGTDDGFVHVSQNDGTTWTNVTANIPDLPRNTWCSRVWPSKWNVNRAYATFDGHRSNDFKPYVYRTDDLGKTWVKLNSGLPDFDSVYCICEGLTNPDLLFLGSEMSLRVSLDAGKTWGRIRNTFPTVAVHDLLVHPRDMDLVIGTHGRSIWTLDISGLEALESNKLAMDVTLAKPQNVLLMGRTSSAEWEGDRLYTARNTQPGTRISYHLKAVAKNVKLVIETPDGTANDELRSTNVAGLNTVTWNGRIDGRIATPGDYRIVLTVDGKDYITSVRVEEPTTGKE